MIPAVKIVCWILIVYVIYCVFLFAVQRHMIFPRHYAGPSIDTAIESPRLEKHWLTTSFGRVEAWLLLPDSWGTDASAPLIIFAHGNAERIDHCVQELKPFTFWGFAVLLVEYPGYGSSEGTPSQKRITEAFLTAYDWILQKEGIDSNRIVLYGRSIGGGVVCALAAMRSSAAIILVSTFTSVRAMAARYLAPGFLVRDPFDNLSVVKKYRHPILIIHGRRDEIIPYAYSMTLHKASYNSHLITYDCGHNDLPPDWKRFWLDVHTFLARSGIVPSAPVSSQTQRTENNSSQP